MYLNDEGVVQLDIFTQNDPAAFNVSTYRTELLAFVAHLLADRPALSS